MQLKKKAPKQIIIPPETARTLDGLFRARVPVSPEAIAYCHYSEKDNTWINLTWAEMADEVARWQAGFVREGLKSGDKIAIMLRNCPTWVAVDQAALGLGLIVVPLYTSDRPVNATYILNDAEVKILVIEDAKVWNDFLETGVQLGALQRVLYLTAGAPVSADPRLNAVSVWKPEQATSVPQASNEPHGLATIIYTSGTTGRPKGVMLSHHNILSNAHAALESCEIFRGGISLSFLPLSHTFERTVGYYLTIMSGTTVAYARSISELAEDLLIIRPTLLISVPRIYERIYAAIRVRLSKASRFKQALFDFAVELGYRRFEYQQGRRPWQVSFLLWPVLDLLVARPLRQKLGGRLELSLSGGAPLPPTISKVFIGLGVKLLQGYGLTETSPVISTNRLRDNVPASVGRPVKDVVVKLNDQNALLVNGPNIMLGYWKNEAATRAIIDEKGWLNTGDIAEIDEQGHIFITGRLKEIIVTSTGEKISPNDMEAAILRDKLFEQVMIVGEGRPYLALIAVVNKDEWRAYCEQRGVDAEISAESSLSPDLERDLLARIAHQTKGFPGYAQIRHVAVTAEPWTVENDLLTATLKLRRAQVAIKYANIIDKLYAGHSLA